MSPEAQRIAIAEACGWQHHPFNKAFGSIGGNGINSVLWPKGLPDYLTDLNAMHEAEKTLIPKTADPEAWRRIEFGEDWLIEKLGPHGAIHATAAERAEAFLRTIGRWDDSK